MTKVLKNTFAAITVALVALMMTVSFASAAVTSSQLEALGFDSAQVALLMTILGGETQATVSTSSYVYQGEILKVGSTGSQVMALQGCLAQLGYNSGSNIDGIFGSKTKAAVMSFQASNGLVADGIVGPKTGPAYQAACATAVVVVETEDEDDSSSDLSDFDTSSGDEVTFSGSDVDDGPDTTIDEGSEMVELGSYEFKNEDSDVVLERVDVILVQAENVSLSASDEEDAWKVFDAIYVEVDGEEVASMDTDNKSDWDDRSTAYVGGAVTALNDGATEDNRVRFSGLEEILSADEDHVVTIFADINTSVDMDANGAQWALVFDETALRFVDEAGITSYLGEEDGNIERVAEFTITQQGDQDEVQVKSSNDDPDSTTLEVKSSQESDEYMVFAFEIEADEDGGDLEFSELRLTVTTTGNGLSAMLSEATLKVAGEEEDYDTASSTVNAAAGTSTLVFDFDGKEFTIDAGDTEEAELYMKFKSTNSQAAYQNGDTVAAAVTGADVLLWDVDGADSLSGATQLSGSATGDAHKLSEEGVIVTLESDSVSTTTNDSGEVKTATYTMTFNVEAFGDTFYMGKIAQNAAAATGTNGMSFSVEDSADAAIANSSVSFALASSASTDAGAWRIDEGETESVTLTATVEIAAAGADTYTRIQANDFRVFTDSALTANVQPISLLPVEDFESALQLINNL